MSLCTIHLDHLELRPGDRVLDLGCGEGRHALSAWLHRGVQVFGLDPGIADLLTARSRSTEFAGTEPAGARLDFVCGDGTALPFADDSFDRLICSEVLEHVPDYVAVLREIKRVLKPGGILAVSVPRFGPEWVCWRLSRAYHEVEGGHIRIFRTRRLRASVEAQGMRCFHRHYAHALHVPYWWLKCLFWDKGDAAPLVRWYHRFLVWDLMKAPRLTRVLDALLNPLMGKSVVLYCANTETR